MNILESVKDLYRGEDNKATHLSIFALTGIMAVAFVNITSLFIGIHYRIFNFGNNAGNIFYGIQV